MSDCIDNQSYTPIATVNPLPFLFAESERFLKSRLTVNSLGGTHWESSARCIWQACTHQGHWHSDISFIGANCKVCRQRAPLYLTPPRYLSKYGATQTDQGPFLANSMWRKGVCKALCIRRSFINASYLILLIARSLDKGKLHGADD